MKKNLPVAIVFFLVLGAAVAAAGEVGNYLVGAGDVLKIAVYDHTDLSATVRVNSDGTILYPLIGQIKVGGLTVSRVASTVGDALADGYIVNPQVSVFVEEFRSRKAIIMGEVKNPGVYELTGPSTLLELISKAGGLNAGAGELVSIKRKTADAREEQITANLRDIDQQGSFLDVPIIDGDSVFVGGAGTLYVTGQVNKPNVYKLDKDTSVIKAITMAGGFTALASKGRIKIIRKVKGVEKILERVPLHTQVLADDVIVVPESLF